MKSYKGFILEFVKNKKYVEYIFSDISKKINNIVSHVKEKTEFNEEYYKIKFNVIDGFLDDDIKKIEHILETYRNMLEKIGSLLIYDCTANEINIIYKDQHSKRVNPPQYLYYVTYITSFYNILRKGLNNDSNKNRFNTDLIEANAIFAVDSKHLIYNANRGHVVIKIDTTKITNKWYEDTSASGEKRYVTYDPIPKEALEKVEDVYSLN